MDCKDVQSKWAKYINGECSSNEELEIEEHLQTCVECEQLLNDELENQQKQIPNQNQDTNNRDVLSELPIKKQNKLIHRAKWKNRVKTALTVFILMIAVIVVSTILTGIYYFVGGNKATQVVKIGTQMTMPNVHIDGTGISTNIFFSADLKAQMKKVLGNENKAVGEVQGKLIFNSLNTTNNWVNGQFVTNLYFLHPHAAEVQPNYKETYDYTWQALETLPEGTVSELALSFDNLYNIDDVQDFLSEYDLHIPWYAINTGFENKDGMYLSNDNGIWGIYDRPTFDVSKESIHYKTRRNGEEIGEEFKKGLRFLAENEKMAKQFLWSIDENTNFKEMYTFVNENGIKTYGVVVTGPTKELLKLKENKHIHYATLGEVDLWNWYNKPAYGIRH